MNRSESIKNLAIALAKFNGDVSSISKDAKNPFFKSDYVTLDKLIVETRGILQKHGLSIIQTPLSRDVEIGISTLLIHESGEYLESEPLYMKPVKNDPQSAGSLITYLRRYSYQAILNLNTGEDDDGNKSTYIVDVDNLIAIGAKVGINLEDIKKVAKTMGVNDIRRLTKQQHDTIVSRLKAKEGK